MTIRKKSPYLSAKRSNLAPNQHLLRGSVLQKSGALQAPKTTQIQAESRTSTRNCITRSCALPTIYNAGVQHTAIIQEANKPKRIPWNKGMRLSPLHIQKLKESHIGQVAWNKGKTKETHDGVRKIAEKKIGALNPMKRLDVVERSSRAHKGYVRTMDSRLKQSKSISREAHWNWKDGRSKTRAYKSFYDAANRAKRRGADGMFTRGEWDLLKKQYGYRCPACKCEEPHIKLTIDHIIPISRGGTHYIENIQPLCKSCNSRKYNRIIKYE